MPPSSKGGSVGDPSKYSFSQGSQFPAHLAQAVGKELLKLRDDLGRGPRPLDVLRFAKAHKGSATAQCFDWDVKSAAEQHWLHTAGQLIRAIHIELIVHQPPKGQAKPREVMIETRLFHNVTPIEPGVTEGREYRPAMETLTNAQYRNQLLEQALSRLDQWRRIYGHLSELKVFFEAIDDANREFGRTKDTAG